MNDQRLYELHAGICQALSYPKRLEILDVLRSGEKSAKELAQAFGVNSSTLSRHDTWQRYARRAW